MAETCPWDSPEDRRVHALLDEVKVQKQAIVTQVIDKLIDAYAAMAESRGFPVVPLDALEGLKDSFGNEPYDAGQLIRAAAEEYLLIDCQMNVGDATTKSSRGSPGAKRPRGALPRLIGEALPQKLGLSGCAWRGAARAIQRGRMGVLSCLTTTRGRLNSKHWCANGTATFAKRAGAYRRSGHITFTTGTETRSTAIPRTSLRCAPRAIARSMGR